MISLEDTKKLYSVHLETLKELFHNEWTEDDLISVLNDYNGDLDVTISRISEGFVKPFSQAQKQGNNNSSKIQHQKGSGKPSHFKNPHHSNRNGNHGRVKNVDQGDSVPGANARPKRQPNIDSRNGNDEKTASHHSHDNSEQSERPKSHRYHQRNKQRANRKLKRESQNEAPVPSESKEEASSTNLSSDPIPDIKESREISKNVPPHTEKSNVEIVPEVKAEVIPQEEALSQSLEHRREIFKEQDVVSEKKIESEPRGGIINNESVNNKLPNSAASIQNFSPVNSGLINPMNLLSLPLGSAFVNNSKVNGVGSLNSTIPSGIPTSFGNLSVRFGSLGLDDSNGSKTSAPVLPPKTSSTACQTQTYLPPTSNNSPITAASSRHQHPNHHHFISSSSNSNGGQNLMTVDSISYLPPFAHEYAASASPFFHNERFLYHQPQQSFPGAQSGQHLSNGQSQQPSQASTNSFYHHQEGPRMFNPSSGSVESMVPLTSGNFHYAPATIPYYSPHQGVGGVGGNFPSGSNNNPVSNNQNRSTSPSSSQQQTNNNNNKPVQQIQHRSSMVQPQQHQQPVLSFPAFDEKIEVVSPATVTSSPHYYQNTGADSSTSRRSNHGGSSSSSSTSRLNNRPSPHVNGGKTPFSGGGGRGGMAGAFVPSNSGHIQNNRASSGSSSNSNSTNHPMTLRKNHQSIGTNSEAIQQQTSRY